MGLLNLFMLEKLQIEAYDEADRTALLGIFGVDIIEVMFNPKSYSRKHFNQYIRCNGINSSGREAVYAYSRSDEITLDIIFDSTGVTEYGLDLLFGTEDVSTMVDKFLQYCFYMDGDIHEPKYLNVRWGELDFSCRLKSVDVTYTLFDNSGMPLRAELKTVFIEDMDEDKRQALAGKNSPDLTHSRTVTEGDTLPLMVKKIYGSTAYYIQVARANNLNSLMELSAGQELFFPPLAK